MIKEVFLYGASGHSKVIIDILELLDISITSVFDDDVSKKTILNYKVTSFNKSLDLKMPCIISIGNNNVRKKIVEKHSKFKYITVAHPSAIIDKTVVLGKGIVVMSGVIINSSTKIGNHCIINTSASIDHDCKIGDYSHISPNATLCGNVTVGSLTHIGAGSVIIQGITIGNNVVIGAGSVIIKDVPNNSVVVGNPGKIIN